MLENFWGSSCGLKQPRMGFKTRSKIEPFSGCFLHDSMPWKALVSEEPCPPGTSETSPSETPKNLGLSLEVVRTSHDPLRTLPGPPQDPHRTPRDPSKNAPRPPKTPTRPPQDAPKTPPRRHKRAPKRKRRPGTSPSRPKRVQDGYQNAPNPFETPQNLPGKHPFKKPSFGSFRGGPQTAPEVQVGSFRHHFGCFSRSLFRVRFRCDFGTLLELCWGPCWGQK